MPRKSPSAISGRRPSPEIIISAKAPRPVGPYPHARRVGNLLFLSGIGPRQLGKETIPGVKQDANGNVVSRDIEAQCHAVFRNVREILNECGASWEQIVDITIFLTHMKEDFPVFNRVYARYFRKNRPCRTTVEVSALPTPIDIEVKIIAFGTPVRKMKR